MSRDWQKDMELCSSVEGEQWINEGKQLEEYDRLTETGCRYIATFDREEDAAFTAEAREALPYWLQQYAAEKERADKAEEREKVLKHAFIVMLGYVPKTARVALDFDEVLASLYPNEETIE